MDTTPTTTNVHYLRMLNPAWAKHPERWVWHCGTRLQGIGLGWREDPGMFNLQWLSLDLDTPPREYDARANPLFMRVLLQARQTTLGGVPLPDVAAAHTLPRFLEKLDNDVMVGPLSDTKPLLRLLGQRRLDHALV